MTSRRSVVLAAALSCCGFLSAQLSAQAQDVGLTMDAGPLPVVLGQSCGPVTCTPIQVGSLLRSETRTLLHFSAPQTPGALAVAAPGPCLAVPGIQNGLLLGQGLVILHIGLTSTPPFSPTGCNQGLLPHSITVPRTLPVGITLRFQSLGLSLSGAAAFGPALDAVVQ